MEEDSRNDYSALFQNFKQSRIIYEERENQYKSLINSSKNDNKALYSGLQQITEELNQLRNDYLTLLQNSERSEILFQERDEVNKNNLKHILNDNEILKRKIYEQKCVIKAQKSLEKGFTDDVKQFEHATNLLELREKSISEKCDLLSGVNSELNNEKKKQADVIFDQSCELDR